MTADTVRAGRHMPSSSTARFLSPFLQPSASPPPMRQQLCCRRWSHPAPCMYTCCSVALGEQRAAGPTGSNSSGSVCRLPWLFYSSHPQCSSISIQKDLPKPGGERLPEIIMGAGRNMKWFPQLRFPATLALYCPCKNQVLPHEDRDIGPVVSNILFCVQCCQASGI